MPWDQILGLVVTLMVMSVGLAGCLLPAVPSTPVVLVAALVHRFVFGDAGASIWVLAVLFVITVFSILMEYLASLIGAKKLGATKAGVWGAVVGTIVGLFFAPLGIIFGPFLGAVSFELLGGRELGEAAKAGTGALIGFFAGTLGKIVCCIAMIGLFGFHIVLKAFG